MKHNILITALSLLLCANHSFAQDKAAEELNYSIIADRLEESRVSLSPKTGSSSYKFSEESIENLPLGQATPLNQVLQRAPGVAINSQGQLHVRGDHSGLQYRINGVTLPEAVNGFGQSLDTHFADEIDFLTGSMPAQYGFRTSGVVDLKTKSGSFADKNRSEITFGQNDTFGVNQQIGGKKGNLDYYVSANYLQNSRGIESTTAARNSVNNDTKQDNLFGYFSYLLEPTKKLSLIVSNSTNRFQVPSTGDQEADYALAGSTIDNSLDLRQSQKESSRFVVAALQGISDSEVDYQISVFSRYSDVNFNPDYQSLVYSGVSSSLDRSSFSNGTQGDFAYALNDKNTLRMGFYAVNDAIDSNSRNYVFTGEHDESAGHGHDHGHFDADSDVPIIVDENSAINSQFYSLYLQNEWAASDKLLLNYGARFDISQSYANESQLSPRFGGVYDFTKKTKMHFGYSRFFTPPSVAAISSTTLSNFDETSNEAEVGHNDQVKAERSHYFDIGVSHQLTPKVTLALDGYYKKSKNVLDEHQFGNSLLYSPFNYEKGKSYGLEFKLDYKGKKLSSYLNLAAQRAYAKNVNSRQYIIHEEEYEYAQNNWVRLDHAQNYTASVGASYKMLNSVFSADALFGSGLSSGENNTNTMASYWQVNGSVAKDVSLFGSGNINVRLSAVNILDEVYQYSNGSGIGVNAAQFAPRRTFFLILSKQF